MTKDIECSERASKATNTGDSLAQACGEGENHRVKTTSDHRAVSSTTACLCPTSSIPHNL